MRCLLETIETLVQFENIGLSIVGISSGVYSLGDFHPNVDINLRLQKSQDKVNRFGFKAMNVSDG